jgi:hypothetical protein
VHEFRIDIELYPGKVFAKPLQLKGEDLPKGGVKPIVESNAQFLRRLPGRDRNPEPFERNFKL